MDHAVSCRFCGHSVRHILIDLGMSPLCQTHVRAEQLNHVEPFFPLRVYQCERCFLVQLEEFVAPAGISTTSHPMQTDWVKHAREYCELMCERFGLGRHSHVVEIACNEGYLLQHFVAKGVPVLGLEPAAKVAEVAVKKGIPLVVKFFGRQTARELAAEFGKPDLLIGNNVLAHVPDLNDFVAGMKLLLD